MTFNLSFPTYICMASPSSLSIGRAAKTSTEDFSDFQYVSFPCTSVLYDPAPFLSGAQRKRAPKTSVTFNMCLSHVQLYCITQLRFYRARSENEHRRLQCLSICVFPTYICIVSPSPLSIGRAAKTSTEDFSDFQYVFLLRTFVLDHPAPFPSGTQRKRAPKTSVTFNMCLSVIVSPSSLSIGRAAKTSTEHFSAFQYVSFPNTFVLYHPAPFYRARSETKHRRLQ